MCSQSRSDAKAGVPFDQADDWIRVVGLAIADVFDQARDEMVQLAGPQSNQLNASTTTASGDGTGSESGLNPNAIGHSSPNLLQPGSQTDSTTAGVYLRRKNEEPDAYAQRVSDQLKCAYQSYVHLISATGRGLRHLLGRLAEHVRIMFATIEYNLGPE